MIDLILWASDRTTLETFAKNNNLLIKDAEDNWIYREGLSWSWWGGSGKVLSAEATFDVEGNELTPATYLEGVVAIIRIHGKFYEDDKIESESPNQHERSKFVKYIHNNGTKGAVIGLNFYELEEVRIGYPEEVNSKLSEWGVPGHIFAGGNSY